MLPSRNSIEMRLKPALDGLSRRIAAVGIRLRRIDLVTGLIAAADGFERVGKALWRLLSWLAPRRSIGLTGALAWRMAAALAGIGCTAALVTGLSAKDEDGMQMATAPMPGAVTLQPLPLRQFSTGPIQWSPVVRPIAMFNLDAPEFSRERPAYAARSGAGAREDLLSFGSFPQMTAHLVLALRTGRLDDAPALPFTVAIAREAAAAALSMTRSSLPVTIETRFGPLESADVVLGDGRETRGCIAFRSAGPAEGFALRGWWCAAGKPTDRRQLSCLIERLDLVNAAGDQDLRTAFAASELRRNPACERAHLSAAGRKSSWLDTDASAPALKVRTIAAEPAKVLPKPRNRPAKQHVRDRAKDPAST